MNSRRNVTNNENEQGNARHANSKSMRGPSRGNRSQAQGFRQPQYIPATVSGMLIVLKIINLQSC